MNHDQLAAGLHELVGAVGVERMTPAGVQRRVKERARRRRLRRSLGSAAMVIAVLLLTPSVWSSGEPASTPVVTEGPLVPATRVPEPAGPATTSTTVAPAPATTPTTSRPGAAGEDDRGPADGGRDRDPRDPDTRD
jgi:hypothetical protein